MTSNITLGTGEGAITLHTTTVKKIYSKLLIKITPPQSTSNWESGPKDTKIVDLLRIEIRFTVNAYIDSTDQSALEALVNGGGIFNMTWKGINYNINVEKIEIDEFDSKEETDEIKIMFTALVGVNI